VSRRLHAEPHLELAHVDNASAMGAIADLAIIVTGFDLDEDAL
jgi:hypothetical protein